MYKLNVKNFQRIKEANLELKGFCVIEGPSNLGKSSICRALGVVTQNQWESGFVSKESKNTSITLETDDFKVNCIKGNLNEFHITSKGKTVNYDKAGKEIPKELISQGFSPLVLGKEKISLLIAEQYDPLFMVIYSDVMNTRILNNVFDVDVIEKANEYVIKDIMNQKRELKRELSFFTEKEEELEQTKSSLKVMLELRDYYDKIDLIDSFKSCQEDVYNHKDKQDVNQNQLNTFEMLENKLKLYSKLTEIQDVRLSVKKVKEELQSLSAKVKAVSIYQEVFKIDKYLQVQSSVKENIELLKEIDNKIVLLSNSNKMLDKFTMLENYQEIQRDFTDNKKELSSLDLIQDLFKLDYKIELLIKLTEKKNAIDSKSTYYQNTLDSIEEYHNQIKQLGICPCCSQTLK